MDNNKRLTPEEMLECITGFVGNSTISMPKGWVYQAMKQYAAQEVAPFKEENERQRVMILQKAKALSDTLDERDNALIWVKSLQREVAEKDALLKEASAHLYNAYTALTVRRSQSERNYVADTIALFIKQIDSHGKDDL